MVEEQREYLDLFLSLGKAMLESGAEIFRVEDTISRLFQAYGMNDLEIFAIRSLIVVSARDGQGHSYTSTKRIYEVGIHMGRLEELNQLSRWICAQRPDAQEINRRFQACIRAESLSARESLFGYMLAAFSFSCFFGGRLRDGAGGAFLGLLLFFMDRRLAPKCPQRLVYIVFASMVLGSFAMLLGCLPLEFQPDKMMIGTIMLLIPGMAFMNSMRDMLSNNEINGLFSCLDTLLTAGAIAIGFVVPLLIGGA